MSDDELDGEPETSLVSEYKKLRVEYERTRRLVWWVGALAVVLLIVAVALGYQVGRRNQHIDRIDEAVARIEKIEARVDATSKRAADSAESARDLVQGAIDGAKTDNSGTVDALTQIRALYCIQFPTAEACTAGP